MIFLLPPWDRNRPRLHPPVADVLVEHASRTFGLRAQNGLLFFRDALDLSKTWAVATPLPLELEGDKTGYELFWRREFERGNIARYVVHLDSYLERTVPLFFRGDGTGWCRESWNRDDIEFTHSLSMHFLLEGADKTITQDLSDVETQLQQKLSNLDWPDNLNWSDGEENIEWLCGSREQLQEVLSWVCALESSFWKYSGATGIQLSVSSENPFSRAYVQQIEIKGEKQQDDLWFDVNQKNDQLTLNSVLTESSEQPGSIIPSRRFWTLCDLAIDENTPLGTYWEYHDYGMGRCADAPNSFWIEFNFDAPQPLEIERARANLREWLRDKLPASERETVLDDDAPAEIPKSKW